jgi:hypothetical protein
LFILGEISNSTYGIGPKCANLDNKDSDIGLLSLFIKEISFKNPGMLVWIFLLIRLRISQKYPKFKALVLCKGYLLK